MAARLLFVCLGNICRSPTAEGVMAWVAADEGVADQLHLDSAGIGDWHVGDLADERARAEARSRGIELTHRARQVVDTDIDAFDLVLAMDRTNVAALRSLIRDELQRSKIRLLREFEPGAERDAEVPDPYYRGEDGFGEVFDMVERSCRGLLTHLRAEGKV